MMKIVMMIFVLGIVGCSSPKPQLNGVYESEFGEGQLLLEFKNGNQCNVNVFRPVGTVVGSYTGTYELTNKNLYFTLNISASEGSNVPVSSTFAFEVIGSDSDSISIVPLDSGSSAFVMGSKEAKLQRSGKKVVDYSKPVQEDSERTMCMTKLKQLSVGFLIYSSDYDDVLPRRTDWMDAIMPYIKNLELLHCPTVSKDDKENYGYAYCDLRDGINLKTIREPAKAELLFDSTLIEKNASGSISTLPTPGRHGGKNNIAYADGHVKSVKN